MTAYLITCEHASAHIPGAFRHLFASRAQRARLATHEAFDIGALDVAKSLADQLEAPLILGEMSRLLIDLNRSERHPHLFSAWSRSLDASLTQVLLRYHRTYRAVVRHAIANTRGPVVHLSIHSFTPVWKQQGRTTDIGLLYDPARKSEAQWAKRTRKRLQTGSSLRIHRNAPYRGTADGLTKYLRAIFADRKYCGLEIEFNQRLLLDKKRRRSIAQAFRGCL